AARGCPDARRGGRRGTTVRSARLAELVYLEDNAGRGATRRTQRARMTRKADFNAEEWSTVVDGPLFAGMRVISADRGGTVRESLAMGRVYQEARQHHGESEFLDELVKSPPSIDPERLREAGGNLTSLVS